MKKEENQTMAEVTWIEGTIDPPQSGEYYVSAHTYFHMEGDKNNE